MSWWRVRRPHCASVSSLRGEGIQVLGVFRLPPQPPMHSSWCLSAVRTGNVQRLCQDKLHGAIGLLSVMRNALQCGGGKTFGKLEFLKKFVRYRLRFLAGRT